MGLGVEERRGVRVVEEPKEVFPRPIFELVQALLGRLHQSLVRIRGQKQSDGGVDRQDINFLASCHTFTVTTAY